MGPIFTCNTTRHDTTRAPCARYIDNCGFRHTAATPGVKSSKFFNGSLYRALNNATFIKLFARCGTATPSIVCGKRAGWSVNCARKSTVSSDENASLVGVLFIARANFEHLTLEFIVIAASFSRRCVALFDFFSRVPQDKERNCDTRDLLLNSWEVVPSGYLRWR